jgi:outer membrane protein assembly factor BamB
VPEAVELAWSEPGINRGTHTAAKGSPLYYDGAVIVPADTGTVYSYAPDGDRNWSASLIASSRGTHATPAIVDDYVFTAGYDGAVYAFDADSGALLWRTKVSDAIGSSPVYYDGVVYCATEFYAPSGGMVALDAATGGIVWEDTRVTNHAHSQTGLDPAAGYFAAGSNDGRLYVWTLDREFHGAFETGDAIKGPVCMHEGRAIFGSWDETVYAVDLDTLTADWEYETAWDVMSGAAIHPDSNTAVIGSHDSHLHAIDLSTGDRNWTFDTGGWIVGSPMVAGDTVLTGSYADALFAVDATSGEERWRFDRPRGWVTATPAVHDGDIYVTERASFDEHDVLQRTGHLYKLTGA